jgi:Secretion system C-terminal sorting domain
MMLFNQAMLLREADISWKFIVELANIYNDYIDIYKLNTSGVYIWVSTEPGYWGTIPATGAGTYKIVGYCSGTNTNGENKTCSNSVYPIYVQDSQSPTIPSSLKVVHSSDNHPKISWDQWPVGLDYQGFKIYKKVTEEMGWKYLRSTINTVHEYVDTTESYPIPGGIGLTHPVSYRVSAYDINGNESNPSSTIVTNVSGALVSKIILSGTGNQIKIENYSLKQNYPNPFNPTTVIQYEVKEPGWVKLEVYDVLGFKVKELVNEVKGSGLYNVTFDATNRPSGIYIYKLNINGYSAVQKMSLLK